MALNTEENIQFFEETLRATQRQNIDKVIEFLKKNGFYQAPASASFHLNEEGGLLQHSINVYRMAMAIKPQVIALNPELEGKLPDDHIAIAALLHDVCKIDVYQKEIKHKKEDGRWIDYLGYGVDYSRFPMGHGEKSLLLLLRWCWFPFELDEMFAIRWHMGAWDLPFQSAEEKSSLNAAKDKCPLLSLLQAADGLAASLLENHFDK